MKLKKIAALALAGMMAVSMLAACSDNTTTDNEEENNIVAAADAAAYANDALSAELKEYITVKTSTTLDGWVKDIATDTSKFSSDDIEYDYNHILSMTDFWSGVPGHRAGLVNALKEKVVDTNVVYQSDFNDGFEGVPVTGSDTQTGSNMYVMSGMLDEKTAVQNVVKSVINGTTFPDAIVDSSNGGYDKISHNCDYVFEVSALKVTNDSLKGKSAWVIGVVVTQTVTEVANVEA